MKDDSPLRDLASRSWIHQNKTFQQRHYEIWSKAVFITALVGFAGVIVMLFMP